MTVCRIIIRGAYRRSGLLAHVKEPNAGEFRVGLELLQDMWYSRIYNGTFGRLTNVILEDDTEYVAKSDLLNIYNPEGADVVLPLTVQLSDGKYRLPYNGALIIDNDVLNNELTRSIYNGSKQVWQSIDGLTLNSECPLTPGHDEDLKNILAMYIAEETGSPISPILVRRATTSRMNLTVNYFSTNERNTGTEYF